MTSGHFRFGKLPPISPWNTGGGRADLCRAYPLPENQNLSTACPWNTKNSDATSLINGSKISIPMVFMDNLCCLMTTSSVQHKCNISFTLFKNIDSDECTVYASNLSVNEVLSHRGEITDPPRSTTLRLPRNTSLRREPGSPPGSEWYCHTQRSLSALVAARCSLKCHVIDVILDILNNN